MKFVWEKYLQIVLGIIILILCFSGCNTARNNTKNANDYQKPLLSPLVSPEMAVTENVDEKYEKLLNKFLKKEDEAKENTKPELYRLKVGDILEISVLDEPEMTKQSVIIPDGTLTYLLVGEIPAAGKNIGELRDEIQSLLEKYLVNPKVSVLVKEIDKKLEEEKRVSIIGAVQNPGEYPIRKGDKIIDVIAKAGGLLYINDWMGGRTVANLKASYISRDGVKLNVDFDKLLRLGDMNYNLPVENADLIYITDAESSGIFVLGEVKNPRFIPYNRDITLVEAISRSGGFTYKAEKSKVIVLRNSTIENEFLYVDVESLVYGNSSEQNIVLKENDIVYVPEQGLSEYSRYGEYLLTFGNMLLQAYQIRQNIMFPALDRSEVWGGN